MKSFRLMAVALLAMAATASAERPQKAPPVDPRFDAIHARLDRIEKQLGLADCPCGESCVCPPGECPGGCPTKKTVSAGGGGLQYTGVGREVLFFTMGGELCPPCAAAEKRLGPLVNRMVRVDCSEGIPFPEFHVEGTPSAVLVVDGRRVSLCESEHVGPAIVGNWLAGHQSPPAAQNTAPASMASWNVERRGPSARPVSSGPTWTWPGDLSSHLRETHGVSTTGMSFEQMRREHDRIHNGGFSSPGRRITTMATRSFCPTCPR